MINDENENNVRHEEYQPENIQETMNVEENSTEENNSVENDVEENNVEKNVEKHIEEKKSRWRNKLRLQRKRMSIYAHSVEKLL